VQFATRSVDGDVGDGNAASAERDQLLPSLSHGAVADEPHIGGKQIFVSREDPAKVDRAGFLFPFEDEPDVRAKL
jgi:hypothetical protein